MSEARLLQRAARIFALTTVFTSVVALRDDLPGRPLGIEVPLSVALSLLVGWGAAVAAPWPMPAAALLAARQAPRATGKAPALVCAAIGAIGVVGLLVEPNTYAWRTSTLSTRAAVVAHAAASSALAACGLRALRCEVRGL